MKKIVVALAVLVPVGAAATLGWAFADYTETVTVCDVKEVVVEGKIGYEFTVADNDFVYVIDPENSHLASSLLLGGKQNYAVTYRYRTMMEPKVHRVVALPAGNPEGVCGPK